MKLFVGKVLTTTTTGDDDGVRQTIKTVDAPTTTTLARPNDSRSPITGRAFCRLTDLVPGQWRFIRPFAEEESLTNGEKKNMLRVFFFFFLTHSHSYLLPGFRSLGLSGVADVFHRTYTEAAVIIIQPSGFSWRLIPRRESAPLLTHQIALHKNYKECASAVYLDALHHCCLKKH